jgi:hypothetical protein
MWRFWCSFYWLSSLFGVMSWLILCIDGLSSNPWSGLSSYIEILVNEEFATVNVGVLLLPTNYESDEELNKI